MSKMKKIKDPFATREAEKYQNPIPSREFILEYLAKEGPLTRTQLEAGLNLVDAEQQEALRRRLIAMLRDGQLLKNRKGAYGPLASMELIAGRVLAHKDGFGFVEPDDNSADLFLSPRQMRGVFHGDKVLVRVASIDNRNRREAVIVEVLEHNTKQLVGRFYVESGVAFVEPSNTRIPHDILIPPHARSTAEHGQIVVVAITDPPTVRARPLGRIIEVLGDHMAPGMEINVAIRNHELPYLWPDEVEAAAAQFGAEVDPSSLQDREDLRELPFVTIDGEDAKDFDDAVYCEPSARGGWTLYVAIADVSHYVLPDSALDQHAFMRGNSVYFPGLVLPMLPETLSNNLCSLLPHQDRLVMVCRMTIQASGRITRYNFSPAVINSKARLTYTQVHQIIEQQDQFARQKFSDFTVNLQELYNLYYALYNARKLRGAIDFDLPETKIVFGKNRKIKKIVPYERFLSHRVIEECMLAANICAAKFFKKAKLPSLYRVHEGPTVEKLENLRKFLTAMGLPLPRRADPQPADYARILQIAKERPDVSMIQTILLRSMSQAIYSPDNRGHFGLAYDEYTHFTSPIRRYPDLLVHRGLKYLLGWTQTVPERGLLLRAGDHCSMTERRADDATNEVKDWLKCEFMLDKLGVEFPGTVSGVTNFGVFVELVDIYVEGLIHISMLPSDYYQFDPIQHVLTGARSGVSYRLGDTLSVTVARVDLDKGEIDFNLANANKRKNGTANSHPPARKKSTGYGSKKKAKKKAELTVSTEHNNRKKKNRTSSAKDKPKKRRK